MAPGTEACLHHDGCFHTAVLERSAGGFLIWHDTCSDRQQVLADLAVYLSAAPARDSAAPAKEHVAPVSQRDLMTKYAQWDKFAADLLSDTDSAADHGSDMCKAGFADAFRAVIRGSGMCKAASADGDGSGMCKAGLAGLADDARADDDDQGCDQGCGYLNSGGNDTCCDNSGGNGSCCDNSGGNVSCCDDSGGNGTCCDHRRLQQRRSSSVSLQTPRLRLVLLSEAARARLVLLVTYLLTEFVTVASAQMVIFSGLVWQVGHVQGCSRSLEHEATACFVTCSRQKRV